MVARIYKPAKTAMQSGTAKTKDWVLDYEPEQPRAVEPLMGWTSSGDMRQQLTLRFESKDEAIAYCERNGIPYQLAEPKAPARRTHFLFGQFRAAAGVAPGVTEALIAPVDFGPPGLQDPVAQLDRATAF